MLFKKKKTYNLHFLYNSPKSLHRFRTHKWWGGRAGLTASKFHRSPVTGCADAEGARKHILRSPKTYQCSQRQPSLKVATVFLRTPDHVQRLTTMCCNTLGPMESMLATLCSLPYGRSPSHGLCCHFCTQGVLRAPTKLFLFPQPSLVLLVLLISAVPGASGDQTRLCFRFLWCITGSRGLG